MSNGIYRFFEALSLSGAIIMLFFSLTLLGILRNEEKVWQEFGTALTTFATGKTIGRYEERASNQKKTPPDNDAGK